MASQILKKASINTDITKMTPTEIEEYLKLKKLEAAALASAKGAEARKDVERYCQEKWGLTLAQVWMAGRGPTAQRYRNPENGTTYTYTGFGRVPEWLKGPDGKKPNPDYLIE